MRRLCCNQCWGETDIDDDGGWIFVELLDKDGFVKGNGRLDFCTLPCLLAWATERSLDTEALAEEAEDERLDRV